MSFSDSSMEMGGHNMTDGESNKTVEVANSTTNSSLSLQCGILDEQYMEVWNACQWWCEGILFTGMGLVGLVANFASIGILATKDMRKHSFNQLLIALAIFDILFILVSIPVYAFSLFSLFVGNQFFSRLYVYFLYPMSPVTLCASIYMTLAITIERYLAVCKPITYRNLNVTMSSTKRALMYVTPVVFVSFCLNIPKFLETQANDTGDNSTEIKASDTRLNPTYMLYYTISQIFHPTLTTGIFPMAALIYMNTSIFFGIRRANAMRNQRRTQNPDQPGVSNINTTNNNNAAPTSAATVASNQARQSENNLAIALIGIVIMHLACHSLRVFLAILSVHLIGDTIFCMKNYGSFTPPLWTMCAESVSSLMIMINFSGNFLIYCSVLTPFKAVLTNSCDAPWCHRLIKIFKKSSADIELEQVDLNGDTQQNQGIVGSRQQHGLTTTSTSRQALLDTKDNSGCGASRVLRMVNRRRKKAGTVTIRTNSRDDLEMEQRTSKTEDQVDATDDVITTENSTHRCHSHTVSVTVHSSTQTMND